MIRGDRIRVLLQVVEINIAQTEIRVRVILLQPHRFFVIPHGFAVTLKFAISIAKLGEGFSVIGL